MRSPEDRAGRDVKAMTVEPRSAIFHLWVALPLAHFFVFSAAEAQPQPRSVSWGGIDMLKTYWPGHVDDDHDSFLSPVSYFSRPSKLLWTITPSSSRGLHQQRTPSSMCSRRSLTGTTWYGRGIAISLPVRRGFSKSAKHIEWRATKWPPGIHQPGPYIRGSASRSFS